MSGYDWLAAALVLVVALTVIDTLPVGVAQDDGWYLILAKSLATGQGYRWINLPGSPPATHFPPGYPGVLAAIWWLVPSFPANVMLFKALNACFLAAAAGVLAVFAHRRLGFERGASALLAIVACIGIPTLVLSTMLMSEPLFLALLLPLLLIAERVIDGDRRVGWVIGIGALAGLATLVRTHGIALIGAIICVLLLRKRVRDAALTALGAIAIVLPWQIWVRVNDGVVPKSMRGAYDSYSTWFAEGLRTEGASLVARTIPRTSGEIAAMFATLGAPSWPAAIRIFVLVTLAGLFIAGARRLWRAAPTTLLFVAFYVTIVVLWPFNPARFVWGIWPLVVLLAVTGARDIARWSPSLPAARGVRYALAAGALVVAVGYLRYSARGYRGRWWSSIARAETRQAQPLVVWARTRTRPDEVIASSVEPMVYLYSGRRTVSVTSFTVHYYFRPSSVSENEAVLRDILSAYRVDAVAVVGNDSLAAAAQAMAARNPPELVLRDTLANGLVFTPARP
jgi:hypothetical protein